MGIENQTNGHFYTVRKVDIYEVRKVRKICAEGSPTLYDFSYNLRVMNTCSQSKHMIINNKCT